MLSAAPGTTPTWIWLVVAQKTWTNTRALFGEVSVASMILQARTSTPNAAIFNSTFGSIVSCPLGTAGRMEAYISNSTSDYLKFQSSMQAGTALGNTAPSGDRILFSDRLGLFGNWSVAEVVYANALPTPAQRAALDAYATARYGAGL